MLVSAVIITKDEAPRLRLVLESLASQTLMPRSGGARVDLEVVVVDDGSTDQTPQVLLDAERRLGLRIVRNPVGLGRSPSRNAGVRAATGEVVVLFDGDCLASPDLVLLHAELHRERRNVMGRGETYHLRCTRFFHDPEIGTPFPDQEERVRRMGSEVTAALVTRQQVQRDFAAVAARGQPGIYAGAGPRRLYELEMRALQEAPEAGTLWMTAPGQNLSLRREEFLAVGGFDERLSINEHRELALRLYQRGARMVPVHGARTFHMLHRIGWRDPLADGDWERIFFEKHPVLATKLMTIFWLSLAQDKDLPETARIDSLEQFEQIVQNGPAFDCEAVRREHPRLLDLS